MLLCSNALFVVLAARGGLDARMVRDRLTDDHALIGVFIVAFLLASSRHQASFSSQSNREKRKERNRRNPISGLFSFFLKSGPVQTGRPLAGEGGRMAGGVSLSVARRPVATYWI